MEFKSRELERLLSLSPAYLPLSQNAVVTAQDARAIRSQDPATLFPGARHAEAALAGLLFRIGCWEESHTVAQDIASKEAHRARMRAASQEKEPLAFGGAPNPAPVLRDSSEGSYWHGMLHRIEPDSSNAKYWFRQVGNHSIFPELLLAAEGILSAGAPKKWSLKANWDPFLFVDWCEEARAIGGQAETTAIAIQMAEWQLLFDWCREVT